MNIREEARKLAIDLIREDAEKGHSVESIQGTYHGMGGPTYSVRIVPGYKIHVTKVGGVSCDETFSLFRIYSAVQSKQVSLL